MWPDSAEESSHVRWTVTSQFWSRWSLQSLYANWSCGSMTVRLAEALKDYYLYVWAEFIYLTGVPHSVVDAGLGRLFDSIVYYQTFTRPWRRLVESPGCDIHCCSRAISFCCDSKLHTGSSASAAWKNIFVTEKSHSQIHDVLLPIGSTISLVHIPAWHGRTLA